MTTHVVPTTRWYVPGSLGREITVTLGWGAVSRVDLLPAVCADPSCGGDHGYDGTVTADDISLRISADADGDAALARAIDFAAALSSAIGRSTSRERPGHLRRPGGCPGGRAAGGYARASLAGVLPAVATSLGVTGYADGGLVAALPPAAARSSSSSTGWGSGCCAVAAGTPRS